jgi:hypothetical protein
MQDDHEVESKEIERGWSIARLVARVKIASHFNLDASLAIFYEPHRHLFAPAIREPA